jgi:hypothetical protein
VKLARRNNVRRLIQFHSSWFLITENHFVVVKSLAPYRECHGRKSFAERNKARAAALSIGAT